MYTTPTILTVTSSKGLKLSFDVVSLFTKVLIDGALQVISTLLAQDESLEERTSITVPDICQLLGH